MREEGRRVTKDEGHRKRDVSSIVIVSEANGRLSSIRLITEVSNVRT